MPDKKEKPAEKKAAAKKPAAKKAPAKKAAAKKPAAKKPAAKKAPANKPAAAKKPAGKKVVVKSAATRERAVERREAREKRPDGYFYAVGRRKRAVAQTKLYPEQKKLEVIINGRALLDYFPVIDMREAIMAPLKAVGLDEVVKVEVKVSGGGQRGQAEAVRHGISRALLLINPDYRLTLKKLGFLTRDPREKERRKYGLKKARRAPQWSKR